MSRAERFRLHGNSERYRVQHGFVLITALMLVVILTLLALAGESLTSTQTRIAANSASQQATFQAAEGALSQAQAALLGGLYAGNFNSNTGGLYTYNPAVAPIWNAANFWSLGSAAVTASTWGTLPTGVNAAYIIEKFPSVSGPGNSNGVYRITAEASQASGGAPVILQGMIEISQ